MFFYTSSGKGLRAWIWGYFSTYTFCLFLLLSSLYTLLFLIFGILFIRDGLLFTFREKSSPRENCVFFYFLLLFVNNHGSWDIEGISLRKRQWRIESMRPPRLNLLRARILKENHFLGLSFFYFVGQAFPIILLTCTNVLVRRSGRNLGVSICISFLFSLSSVFLFSFCV
ncbi:hypothetical protein DFP73DRAFT_187854 [Morchella snyderi]|nr:hypothetical protein DFP73DRAFT_187854 [Morchella snyderi]